MKIYDPANPYRWRRAKDGLKRALGRIDDIVNMSADVRDRAREVRFIRAYALLNRHRLRVFLNSREEALEHRIAMEMAAEAAAAD